MSVISPTITQLQGIRSRHATKVVWTPVTNADTCAPVELAGSVTRSIHVSGTFGSATVVLQGSNTATTASNGTYVGLNKSPAGTAISLTSEGINLVNECTTWTKPTFSGGDGTQSLTVTMIAVGF